MKRRFLLSVLMATLVMASYSAPARALSPETAADLSEFYAQQGGRDNFPEHYVRAIEAFLTAEDALAGDDKAASAAQIDDIFTRFPLTSSKWYEDATIYDLNVGVPIAYYGLRMLDQIVRFSDTPEKETLHMTAVVATCASVTRPTLPDLAPETVQLAVDSAILADNSRILHQSTNLFRRWVKAITQGNKVELTVHPLDTCATVGFNVSGNAIFSYPDARDMVDSVPLDIRERTDIWWVVAPSGVPGDGSDFEQVFVTGGMGTSNTGAPLFISDDAWFTRKPAHLGRGSYSEIERRLYMPQWFQHEFMHHLFRTWPEFELEAVLHQWFDRDTWPEDFVGQNESDYFAESIEKRLLSAMPSISMGLDRPTIANFTQIPLSKLVGDYQRLPIENDFHEVRITVDSAGTVTWSNMAEIAWKIRLEDGELQTEATSPYGVEPVYAELDELNRITAMIFLGERYVRIDVEAESCWVIKAANDRVINFCL